MKKELHLDNEGKPVVDSASGTTGGTPANNTNGLAAQADKDGVVPITNQDLEAGDAPTPGGGAVMAANSKEGEDAKKSEGDGEQEEEEEESRFAWPDSWPERILFIVSFPFLVAFTYTIPDCGKPKWEAWYVVSFAMSIVWIGGLCWGMVVCASEVGCILNIDPVRPRAPPTRVHSRPDMCVGGQRVWMLRVPAGYGCRGSGCWHKHSGRPRLHDRGAPRRSVHGHRQRGRQ